MGAAQSAEARSVSIDNPTPAGVIDVSDEVVERLKKGITKQVRENVVEKSTPASSHETRAAVKPTPPPQIVTTTPSTLAAITPSTTAVSRNAPSVAYQSTPTYSGGITLTAVDVIRQKELELQQNDAEWRQRMADLELSLGKTNATMEKEYEAGVEVINERFASPSPLYQLPPCQDLKTQIISCYRENPRETLKCFNAVDSFNNCINSHRVGTNKK